MLRRIPAFLLSTLLLGFAPLAADDQKSEWTLDDILKTERAGSWTISPDSEHAAWIRSSVAEIDGAEKRISHLFLSSLTEESDAAQLTRTGSVSSPRFSPDGKHLSFVTTRDAPPGTPKIDDDAKSQIWALPLGGGEAFPLTRLDRGVRSYAWIDDETLVVSAQESPALYEQQIKKKKDTTRVPDDAPNEPPVRLFRVALDGEITRLTDNLDWIRSVAVSPDGRWAVVRAQQSLHEQFDQKIRSHTRLIDLQTGDEKRLFVDQDRMQPFAIQWSPDSSGFFFLDSFTNHPVYDNATINHLHHYAIDGETQQIDPDWDWGVSYAIGAQPDGVVALLAEGVRFRPAFFAAGDWKRQDLEGAHARNIDAIQTTPDGKRLLYQTSTASTPPQWYVAELDGARLTNERRLTDLNAGWKNKPSWKSEIVRWTGALDEEVEGVLQYPLGWEEGDEPAPLILDIHGGPTGYDRDSWSQSYASPNVLWQQRGAFVFQVNYHGSGNYGLDWAESIAEHYYEYEIPDIEKGVDFLIERGLVDPDMLGTTGWSNGGILSAELITRTQRYKAASVGAADVEWISDWGNVDFGAAFDNYYFGSTPWEAPQTYIDKSPFFRLTEVTTPTIIHTGTEDVNVPPHQSWSLFRALRYIEKAPARLLTYPGEPHGLRQIVHQRRKAQEDLDFFDHYLFGKEKKDNPALKKGSPLDLFLKQAQAKHQNGLWGVEKKDKLLPETIMHKDLKIGRFEVTRAQWASFDRDYDVAPGTENLPATGMTFEKAKEYVAWLSKSTGEDYRLPTTKEAKKLAGKGGNTLDHWAGYAPNPEDAARLSALIKDLEPDALLRPAGSLPGSGDDPVYDLDGNAAEWASGDDGGIAVGPSADQPSDKRSKTEPNSAYVGLRVLLD